MSNNSTGSNSHGGFSSGKINVAWALCSEVEKYDILSCPLWKSNYRVSSQKAALLHESQFTSSPFMPFSSLTDLLENSLVLLKAPWLPSVGCRALFPQRREVPLIISPKSLHKETEWLAEGCLEARELALTWVLGISTRLHCPGFPFWTCLACKLIKNLNLFPKTTFLSVWFGVRIWGNNLIVKLARVIDEGMGK